MKQWTNEVRIKGVCALNPPTAIPKNTDELCFFPMETISVDGGMVSDERKSSSAGGGYSICQEGDVVFAKVTPCFENGKSSIVPPLETTVALATTEITVLRPSKRIFADFLHYRIKGFDFTQMGESEMKGAGGLKRVPERHVASFSFLLPPLAEQKAIAEFLDRETALIDKRLSLIGKKRELLKELRKSVVHEAVTKGLDKDAEMVDSGVEWIGKIPSGWKIERLSKIAYIENGYPFDVDSLTLDNGTPVVKMGNFSDIENFQYTSEILHKKYEVVKGDILIGLSGSLSSIIWIGPKAYLNQRIAKVSINKAKSNSIFLLGALQFAIEYLSQIEASTTIKNLSKKQVDNILIPLPPPGDQKVIADCLDMATGCIDKMLSILARQESLLKEQRKALVHEVVTGKRRVLDFSANERNSGYGDDVFDGDELASFAERLGVVFSDAKPMAPKPSEASPLLPPEKWREVLFPAPQAPKKSERKK